MKKGKKRLLSILLCGGLIAALLPLGVLAEVDDSIEDEFAIEEVVPDEGTSDVPEEETALEGSDVSAAEGTGEEIPAEESSESSDTDAGSLPGESGAAVVEGTVEEIPLDTITYVAEEEGLLVEVTTSDDAFPDGGEVELHVALFEEDSDEYREAAEAIDYAEDDARGMAALDLFFTVDGVETEPAAPVQVKIDLSELLPEDADTGSLEVQHLEEKRFGRVKSVVVATAEENDEVEGTIDEETAVAEFELESFSTFTVTWKWEGSNTTYAPWLTITVYLDDEEMQGFENLTFDTVDYELDLMTLLDTNMLEGEGDHTFEYAYLTYTSGRDTVTLGSTDNSIVAIEIEDGHGSPDGNYFRIIYADGTYTTEVPADDNNSANVSLFVYYTTPDPAVEITSADQDIYGDWLVQANLKHVGNYATVTYDWKVVDANGDESVLAYVDRADSVGGAYIVWHTDLVESGSVVYVEVTATVTYEDGSILYLTDTHELDYGLEVVTLAVTYGTDSNEQPVPAGVEVTLSHQVYEEAVYTYTTDESGEITGSFVQGVYDVEAEATIDGQHYSYSGTITIDASGTYTINLMEDDVEVDSGQLPEKDDWNHVDIKLSASSSSYGVSSGATEFTITSVIITDADGNQKYVADQDSIEAGGNMTEFKIQFYEVVDGVTSSEYSHTISFSSEDVIIIGYDIWYESTDSTMSYTVKITQSTAYPHGTAYPATGERAYKLYNYLYGTAYQSDAELLAAGVTEIDISGMSILLVGAILCDSSEVTGVGQVTGTEGMWGFDFTMSPEAFAILGNTWVCDLEKTYLNHELTEKEFYFYFVDGDYDDATGYWSLDDEYWYYELYNGTVIRGIDGNASDTLPGIYVTFDDSRFWYDVSREDSDLFQYDGDGNLIVDEETGRPLDEYGNPIENNQRYGRHHYYILAEQPGEDPYTLYDGTVFGIDVYTYADDPYDMNSEAHIVGTYYLLTLVDGEWETELDLNWTGELYTGNTKVTLDETEDDYPTFHFVNEYVDYLLLYKEDANGRSVSGAKFTLVQEAYDDGGAFAYYYYDPYLEAAEPWVYIGTELTGDETLTAFELGDLTITNDDGEEVEVCGMKLSSPYDGTYYLTEVEAPGGYALLPAGIVFTVKNYRIVSVAWADEDCGEDIDDYVILPLDSYNYELYLIDPYSVRIYKQDENGKSIAGAKFTLTLEAKNDAGETTGYYYYSYDEDSGVGSWIKYDPDDNTVELAEFEFVELTETYVDENGNTQSMTVHGFDLDSPLNGTYTLTEVSAPDGVTLIPYGISFDLDTGRIVDGSFGWAEGYEGDEDIENYVSLGSPNEGEENSWQLYANDPDVIRLYKVDMAGNALDGAYFTLTRTEENGSTSYYDPDDPNGPWVTYTGETEIPAVAFGEMSENAEDEYGNETIETVYGWELDSPANGTYVLTEVTAPAGYELLPGAVTFTVENYRIVEGSVGWADGSVDATLSDYVTVGDEEENWQLILADEAVFRFGLEKVDGEENPLDGATFTLYSDEACTNALGFIYDATSATYTLAEDPTAVGYTTIISAGSVTIAGIEEGTYYMKENGAPEGYVHLTSTVTVTVEASDTTGVAKVTVEGAAQHVSVSEDDNNTIIVKNDANGTTRIDVVKVWDDEDNQDGVRPSEITVTLLEDGQETEQTLTLEDTNNWSGSFTNLPVYQSDDDGEEKDVEISYGISESFDVTYHDDYEEGIYTTTYEGIDEDGSLIYDDEADAYVVTITNSYTPETTRISGSKVWVDEENQYNRRPTSITVNLLANGIKIDELTVTADASGDWSWAFTELPKYENGTEILYTFTEDRVDEYDTTYSADTLTITNTFNPGTVSVTVNKAWNDDESYNHRPESIEVELLADGVETDQTLTLSEGNSWTGSFTGLDKYNTSGVEVVYTVAEITDEALKYYLPKISGSAEEGYTILNQRRYFPIDEEIVVDEDDRGSWVKNEAVNEYNAIEIEMSTYLPLIDPTEVAEGDFVMNFHEVLDYELTLDELDGDFSVYINNQKISHDYYVITTASTASPTSIQPYAMGGTITDGCSFHADVDLSALYRDGVIGDDDFLGNTEIMITFYADLEGTGLNGSYKSTVWYEVYDGETLEYTSNVDVVYVYTYEIEIIKYDTSTLSGTDYAGSALAGATLGIYYDVTCENPVYRSAGIGADESERQPYTVTSGDDGYAMFYGLADGTYYIRETEAPDGYQLSNEVLTVTLDSSLQNTDYTYEAAGYANSPVGWEPPAEEVPPTKTSDINNLILWLLLAASGTLFAVAGGVLAGRRKRRRS